MVSVLVSTMVVSSPGHGQTEDYEMGILYFPAWYQNKESEWGECRIK
jgi:hypothetical protein